MDKTTRMYQLNFGEIYPLYVAKVERKERTAAELDEVLSWLTGLNVEEVHEAARKELSLKELCESAPRIAETTQLITGVICGYRVEDIEDPIIRRIRAMDKVVDELAKGKKLEKIKREPQS
ncbi:DUF2200 family protein [Staphylococcus chromogenes]|nr:DUF2200 family protein [Staphylococcus chromogenes]